MNKAQYRNKGNYLLLRPKYAPLASFFEKLSEPPLLLGPPLIKFLIFRGKTCKKLVLLLGYPNNVRAKCGKITKSICLQLCLSGLFVFVLVVAQLAQNADPL